MTPTDPRAETQNTLCASAMLLVQQAIGELNLSKPNLQAVAEALEHAREQLFRACQIEEGKLERVADELARARGLLEQVLALHGIEHADTTIGGNG